jgi:uncharacterized protein (TIGR00730 family)
LFVKSSTEPVQSTPKELQDYETYVKILLLRADARYGQWSDEDRYFEAARETGRLLAQNGMRCVCGAGNQGLMGTLADSVLKNGGEVLGVIPRFMIDEGWCHKGLTETIVTADMHERKERMAQEVHSGEQVQRWS